jgi:asparagine synthase (glutamine-hydrolysing)
MCGIVGYWSQRRAADRGVIGRMTDALRHRGPDSAGVWIDGRDELALGHRRLSIIDLSPSGRQPMVSPCGRYVISFNGEIYNHMEIRQELDQVGGGFDWRGRSDTETLLAALRHWGLLPALERLNGMFAFALWDGQERRLHLARDRLGEKPLYYGHNSGTFFFTSELKALKPHPDWRPELDAEAAAQYFRVNYVPAPYTIYRGFHKLPPGHVVTMDQGGARISPPHAYWDAGLVASEGVRTPLPDKEVVDRLQAVLREAVASRMEADVPLGAFLSGGIDSSLIVAMMQEQSSRPVKTFTIGFAEDGFDEAPFANEVAKHLGADHTALYVSAADALRVIPGLASIWDEPYSDPSQVPTLLVSHLARKHVAVALSGDGGDELLCGYVRYAKAMRLRARFSQIPGPLRRALDAMLSTPVAGFVGRHRSKLPRALQVGRMEMANLAHELLRAGGDLAFYNALRTHWLDADRPLSEGFAAQRIASAPSQAAPGFQDMRDTMMFQDMVGYLPDDILTKVDRASMAVGLEARAPLLDHRVVEFAWRIPAAVKTRGGQGKWPLRQVLGRYLPESLYERPKQGFSVPVGEWLRGPLRDWAEDLLDERRLREDGLLDVRSIRARWEEHVSGRRAWPDHLWDVLMFQSWLRSEEGDGARAGSDVAPAAAAAPALTV